MVNYERIRKLELVFGCLVSVTCWLTVGLMYLQRREDAAELTPAVLLFLVPHAAVTLGAFIHTVLRNIAGLVLIIVMGVPIVLGIGYLLFLILIFSYSRPLGPQEILTLLIFVALPGSTLLTIVLAGIFGNPKRHVS